MRQLPDVFHAITFCELVPTVGATRCQSWIPAWLWEVVFLAPFNSINNFRGKRTSSVFLVRLNLPNQNEGRCELMTGERHLNFIPASLPGSLRAPELCFLPLCTRVGFLVLSGHIMGSVTGRVCKRHGFGLGTTLFLIIRAHVPGA